jgi:hypothetical protein
MSSLTFGELKLRSNRIMEDPPVKDFELALRELIDSYRGQVSKTSMLDMMMIQRDLVDEEWRYDEVVEDAPATTTKTETHGGQNG